jgi:carbon storage regulator
MLVLTRRPGEQIVIGNGIRVTVVSVGPGRVKIGIEAPENVRIDRQEVHDKIQREQNDHGSDVLAAVARAIHPDDVSPTVVAGGETSTNLRNRMAEQMPVASVPTPVMPAAHRHRLPRKSR